jgi:aerobic C4-dicarboxylate transport protein
MQPVGTTFIAAMQRNFLADDHSWHASVGNGRGRRNGVEGAELTFRQIGTIIVVIVGLAAINFFRLGDGVHAEHTTIGPAGPPGPNQEPRDALVLGRGR